MLKKDLTKKTPISNTIGIENITNCRFGAVISRAGVGKTSFLVQIALTELFRDRKILHISLDDNIEKINLRYRDGYFNLINHIGYIDAHKAMELWEEINTRKVGVSYTEATFDTEKIRDYLKSFKNADLTLPSIIILDGLDFDTDVTQVMEDLIVLNEEFDVTFWLSMKNHREEPLSDGGFPIQLETHKNRFDKALLLHPVKDKIEAVILKDGERTDNKTLLNAANMMTLEDA